MNEAQFFPLLLWGSFGLAAVVFGVLFFLSAPYGRHTRGGWGPTLPNTVGWVIMECPSAVLMAALFLVSERTGNLVPVVLFAMWELHYGYRAFIYPFRLRSKGKRMPVVIMLSGVAFNCLNAYLVGRYLFTLGPTLEASWLSDPRFIGGALLFVVGMGINHQSDAILLRLRRPGETGYTIPRGGMYRYVTSPNYLGECLQWSGFAIATWCVPALAFAVWTVANLAPRARTHQRWYQQKFADYPPERRILVPFIW